MLSLSAALYKRCRDALLSCDQFKSNDLMRNIFIVEELLPFRYSVQDASSPAERVDRLLEYLLEHTLNDGRPVFPLFLQTLQDRYPGDPRGDELAALLQAVQALGQTGQAEPPVPPQILHDELRKLDFLPQFRRFQKVIESYRVAAFLIHGPLEHGQRVLARRLSSLRPQWERARRVVIDVGSSGIGYSSHALWRQIANHMGLDRDFDKEKLAENVCKWWETQDVIMIFYTVDAFTPEILANWLNEFWMPISTAARQKQPLVASKTHLLLFLVDFKGQVCDTNIPFLDQPEQIRDSWAPLKLPPAARIREDDIDYWISSESDVLPGSIDAAEVIAATENGIPNLVYEKICDRYGINWEGE